MPTPTYTLITSNLVSSAVSSVTLSGITNSYRDLRLVAKFDGSDSATCLVRINDDSANNYSYVFMMAQSSPTSGATTVSGLYAVGWVHPTNNIFTMDFFEYASTNKQKSILSRSNNQSQYEGTSAWAQRWASTSAITSLTISNNVGNFAVGSTFYLYGIAG